MTRTTSVRRLISLFGRSSGSVGQVVLQWLTEGPKAGRSSPASHSIASTQGNWRPSMPAMTAPAHLHQGKAARAVLIRFGM